MVSMRVGAIISLLGVAVAFVPSIYYLTLSVGSPMRKFLTQHILALPLILYFTIAGGAITALGLLLFVRAARAPIEAQASSIVRRPYHVPGPAPPPRPAQPARRAARSPRKPRRREAREIAAEIEREIEEIVQSGAVEGVEEAGVEELEEEPLIKVVTRGQDMVCPNCGELNKLGSKKCSKCKKPLYELEEGEPTCPVCGAPLRSARKITEDRFVCGLCFSELVIPEELQKVLESR